MLSVDEILKIIKPHRFFVNVIGLMFVFFLCQTFYFGFNNRLPLVFFLLALPCALFAGGAIGGFEFFAASIRKKIIGRFRRTIIGFISFFVYIVSYSVMVSLLMSYPLGWTLVDGDGGEDLVRAYVLFSTSFVLPLSFLAWGWWLLDVLSEEKRKNKDKI